MTENTGTHSLKKSWPSVADLRGGGTPGKRAPPMGQIFSQFHAVFRKFLAKSYVAPAPGELAPPPTGNPGSAPGHVNRVILSCQIFLLIAVIFFPHSGCKYFLFK